MRNIVPLPQRLALEAEAGDPDSAADEHARTHDREQDFRFGGAKRLPPEPPARAVVDAEELAGVRRDEHAAALDFHRHFAGMRERERPRELAGLEIDRDEISLVRER